MEEGSSLYASLGVHVKDHAQDTAVGCLCMYVVWYFQCIRGRNMQPRRDPQHLCGEESQASHHDMTKPGRKALMGDGEKVYTTQTWHEKRKWR